MGLDELDRVLLEKWKTLKSFSCLITVYKKYTAPKLNSQLFLLLAQKELWLFLIDCLSGGPHTKTTNHFFIFLIPLRFPEVVLSGKLSKRFRKVQFSKKDRDWHGNFWPLGPNGPTRMLQTPAVTFRVRRMAPFNQVFEECEKLKYFPMETQNSIQTVFLSTMKQRLRRQSSQRNK